MNSQELKKLKKFLKPLIRECIKEAIFEEGVLSTLVAEVASGMGTQQITEQKQNTKLMQQERSEAVSKRLKESRSRMMEAVGKDAYGGVNVFEGTEPLSSGGSAGGGPSTSPLANMDPKDKGVNIDGLLGAFGKKWDALK